MSPSTEAKDRDALASALNKIPAVVADARREERAALLAELKPQHRRVEVVTQDGDDWTGCLCGEPDDNCLVLNLIRRAGTEPHVCRCEHMDADRNSEP